jgi:sulfoxide reductase catalytic subunit YedY
MSVKKRPGMRSSGVTPKKLSLKRREFIAGATALAAGALASGPVSASLFSPGAAARPSVARPSSDTAGGPPEKLVITKRTNYADDEKITPYEDATNYTNFYEFSTAKRDPARLARDLRTHPWTVEIDGLVKQPLKFEVEELIRMFPLEERIYRLRCVEAWSMVIPWDGFPLADLIRECKPTPEARFVEFTTLYDPKQMPMQNDGVLHWPYVEGLRLDEAMHPLTILAVGMYGEPLPPQNGGPLRLVVPWKYGFKSIKSIAKIRFMDRMPKTSWVRAAPGEYGFYANVNPNVSHPRWSQSRERRIGESGKRPTLMFNGYQDQVESLYAGMNLRRYF